MLSRRKILLALLGGCATVVVAPAVTAGGVQKRILRSAMKRLLRRDAARDAATTARRLAKPKRVWRYTSKKEAQKATRGGLPAGKHMTPGTRPGRPPTPGAAQRRYGLPKKPAARLTIELPKGQPVRRNKALGGQPGAGEITSPKPLPPSAIKKTIPLS